MKKEKSKSDVAEDVARKLMAGPKFGDPASSWHQDKAHIGTQRNTFGVMDEEGATIRGLQVEFLVFRSPRIARDRLTFTLSLFDNGRPWRVYQQEINPQRGLKPSDHAYSHEHVGDARLTATSDWSSLDFREAVTRFCRVCNLTLEEPLPDLDDFKLR